MPTSSRRWTKARSPPRRSTCFRRSRCRPQSPLWSHPKVTITPHVAGDISPAAFVDQLFEQVDRFERGEPLENEVDRKRGY